ncbi:MAG TPA: antibiotic biosynthesis monooxygenase family protein, partial [Solirubrobacteraceae bacterium]|nr:antibiotic biosynthesis monooxygenase family protein [Solirubrobacteraceae bacterium]
MEEVGRYAKMVAKPGRGEDLAAAMLRVAASLQDVPGCDLYVINRELDDPETIWVTELWRSQEDVDAALQSDAA